MKNILIDVQVDKEKLAQLKNLSGTSVSVIDFSEQRRMVPKEILRDKHILFCSQPPLNFQDMRSLAFIQIASSGYTQLLPLSLAEKGIRACNAQGVFDVPIAEWCVCMMVALARDLRGMVRNQEARIWDRSARFQKEVRGSIVGIWGYGSIGRETARLAKCMGMQIYAFSRNVEDLKQTANVYRVPGSGDPEGVLPDRVFGPGQESAFLQNLDFLILTMPLTRQTRGIVGEKELRTLPDSAFVLNPARGPIIEEKALLRALQEGWIAGAALDTHYQYPMPADHPLWGLPNVIFTPHISGSSLSPHFTARIWDIFVQNVERFLAGQPLLNELSNAKLRGD